ncbi:MAG: Histidine--tRNA ligase [Firmicutes bacterium ADurb.Bin182]|nr:MAG: Histidine--tRNA ligase [Firmicutes bacterium ADurb.Bin182]
MQIRAPKGTRDVIPQESYKWQYVENIIREKCDKYCLNEIRTPIIEHTELFLRGVGDTTDIVQKEMYTFLDKGDRSITLKPEGTAGAVRMFLENNLFNEAQPTKMYYVNSPVFRYDKPQAGRFREHHQFGIEIFGAERASADAECIKLALDVITSVGVQDLSVNINSIGCPECRPAYNHSLKEYLKKNYGGLCETCKGRFETNPLRILDCKEDHCRQIVSSVPHILDYLCKECADHFKELKECLASAGIRYSVNPHIVRGLDYYTKTVFEIIFDRIGSQGAVCGGGRYDCLIEQLGGPPVPGVGFGMGMERLLLVAENQGVKFPEPKRADIFIATFGNTARIAGFRLVNKLRDSGFKAEFDHVGRSMKAQFKYANKLNARYVASLGDDEMSAGVIKLKHMNTGEERTVPYDSIIEFIKE